jgi:ABC-type polysaccharide/polyol phosphate transport system ATPase subunit
MFSDMTETIAVSVKNVSKKYRLFNSPKDRFLEVFHPLNKKYHRDFWALKGITMEILKGQTVGIIGRNGSGKSTLLQIICSILKPTTGEISVNGRVSALLELGAGFNQEFTGRENVFINGALMGFSHKEMEERMPVIESFADIGEFIDQPVKIYSSGMFVRLAFACAINVDPDILIVDEALAVGDAKFQYKCYQKFHEFQEAGKTIILVTHDINAIVKHCDYAFLLENGTVFKEGEPRDVVNYYIDILEGRDTKKEDIVPASSITENLDNGFTELSNNSELDQFLEEVPKFDQCHKRKSYHQKEYRQSSPKCEIIDYLIVGEREIDPTLITSGETIDIYLKVKYHTPIPSPLFGMSIKTVDGLFIYGFNSFFIKKFVEAVDNAEIVVFKFSVKMKLHAGDYFFDFGTDEKITDTSYNCLERRCAIAHIEVLEKYELGGFVDLEADCQEILRKKNRP